jgi:hypothetical protein
MQEASSEARAGSLNKLKLLEEADNALSLDMAKMSHDYNALKESRLAVDFDIQSGKNNPVINKEQELESNTKNWSESAQRIGWSVVRGGNKIFVAKDLVNEFLKYVKMQPRMTQVDIARALSKNHATMAKLITRGKPLTLADINKIDKNSFQRAMEFLNENAPYIFKSKKQSSVLKNTAPKSESSGLVKNVRSNIPKEVSVSPGSFVPPTEMPQDSLVPEDFMPAE